MSAETPNETSASFHGTAMGSQTSSRTSGSGRNRSDSQTTSLQEEITYWTSRMGVSFTMPLMSVLDGRSISGKPSRSTHTSFTDDEIYAEEERVSSFL